MSVASLLNLGPASERMLACAGVDSQAQLQKLGAVAAFLAVREAGFTPSLNLLWALHGSLTATCWNQLTPETRQRLLAELAAAEECSSEGP